MARKMEPRFKIKSFFFPKFFLFLLTMLLRGYGPQSADEDPRAFVQGHMADPGIFFHCTWGGSLPSPLCPHEVVSGSFWAALMSLLDNYETSTAVAEVVTPEEEAANNRFLDALLETEVMKLAHQYLVRNNWSKSSLTDFKAQLYSIWFQLYSRDGQGLDSCGFEHVFVGETLRGRAILGFHNWVQFYLQEKQGNIDYKGYVARQSKSRPDEHDQVLNLQFSWKELLKPVGSTFLGVSPEFEFALFTIVFLQSQEKVTEMLVHIEEYDLKLVVTRHGNHIGSAYPVLLSCNHEEL